jgi:hypothetical protein
MEINMAVIIFRAKHENGFLNDVFQGVGEEQWN